MDLTGAHRTLFPVRVQRRSAGGAQVFGGQFHLTPAQMAGEPPFEPVGHAHHCQVLPERVAPAGQPTTGIYQLQRPNPRMVVVSKGKPRTIRPIAPCLLARRPGQHAAVGDGDQALFEAQPRVQIQFQAELDLLALFQYSRKFGLPRRRDVCGNGSGSMCRRCHLSLRNRDSSEALDRQRNAGKGV